MDVETQTEVEREREREIESSEDCYIERKGERTMREMR